MTRCAGVVTGTDFTRSRRSSRTPDPGFRLPDSGTVAETETETVTESETVTGSTWSRWSSRTPDPGLRTPDSGPRVPVPGLFRHPINLHSIAQTRSSRSRTAGTSLDPSDPVACISAIAVRDSCAEPYAIRK